MPDDVASFPDDDALRAQFGPATYARARQYLEAGHVLECTYQFDGDGDVDIRGRVRGSAGLDYSAFLSSGGGADGPWVYTRCSCPVADQCKHALALLLSVIEQEQAKSEAAGAAPGGRGWERQLDLVLDELDADADVRAASRKPLALQVDVSRPAPPKRRWQAAPTGRGHLRIRPLQRGARGRWVRTGVSWQAMPSLERRGDFDPEQAGALAELLAVHQSAQRHGYFGAEPFLRLQSFGPSLWSALERVIAAGVDLVAGEGLAAVSVQGDAVGLQLDVSAVDDARTQVRLGAMVGEHWYPADAIELLGDTGHGAALWLPGETPYSASVTLAPLSRPAGPQVRRLLATSGALVVPREERAELVAGYLPRLQRHLGVGSSDGTVVVPEPVHPRLGLTVTWVAIDEVSLAWSFRYLVGADDRVYGLTEARGLRAGVRRPAEERSLLDELRLDEVQRTMLCRSHRDDVDPIEQQTLTGMDAVVFAEDVLPGLAVAGQVEIDEIGGRPNYTEAKSAPVIHFAARADAPADGGDTELIDDRTDWLDLEVIITVDGQALALPELVKALTRGKSRIVLANGVHVALDHAEFQHLAELIESAGELHEQPVDGVRVSHHDLGLWEELAEIGVVDAQAGQWVQAAQALRGIDSLPARDPVGVTADLRHYQIDGFRWLAFLWESRLGGILGDDMGLGKTLQTLALVAHARSAGSAPFLVVAPTSVVSTWVHEAAAFTPGLTVRAVTESQARRGTTIAQLREGADVVVTSYTLYRLESDAYVAEGWGGLVLDEAQAVKNHLSKTYQAVRRLEAPFRLAITGTPMENRLMELWSLLSIVAPGLYAYPDQFTERVAVPVEKLGDGDALRRFRRRIRPFLLRRTKDLVAADLPPKQEQVLEVQLTPKHRRVYDTHLQRERQNVLGLVEDFDKHRIAIFRSLTKLRQLSLDASLIDEEYSGVGSAKLDTLVDHLHEILAEGHRALVFSQFTSFLTRVRSRLDAEGISSTYLDGRTRRRAEVIDEFKQGDAGVFLISLKAGGVGLTLTEADYVFVLDPWWNPAVEAQAVDRAHRIGQDRPVMVYRLVATGTIEEKVMELKDRKAALFAKVLDGDGAMSAPITAGDVRALFAD